MGEGSCRSMAWLEFGGGFGDGTAVTTATWGCAMGSWGYSELSPISRWIQPLWILGIWWILGNGAMEAWHGWRLVVALGMSQLSPPGDVQWRPLAPSCAPFLDGSTLSGFLGILGFDGFLGMGYGGCRSMGAGGW